MEHIKILDCTLRDGGYYTNWNFSSELVQDYLHAMSEASISYIEIGFRTNSISASKGALAYTSDFFLRSIHIPNNLNLGVMVNASELIEHDKGVVNLLENLFVPAHESPLCFVRIACHVNEYEQVMNASKWLKQQGYLVGFNLMQITECNEDEIKNFALLAEENSIDILYFADSLGALYPDDVSGVIKILRENWMGPLGIHTHDNLGNALANSLQGINEGVTWVDSTVAGMGRGPGNAKTENLILEVENINSYNLIPLLKLINSEFNLLKEKYKWGTNSFYYLAGKHGIHPTYIQQMQSDLIDENDILSIIDLLKGEKGKKYSVNTLKGLIEYSL